MKMLAQGVRLWVSVERAQTILMVTDVNAMTETHPCIWKQDINLKKPPLQY